MASISMARREFDLRLSGELRTYWKIAAALAYAERWWRSMPPETWPALLSQYDGDDVEPFVHLRMSPQDLLTNQFYVLLAAREHAVVALVTNFESYLGAALERAYVLQPALLADSKMQFTASELSSPEAHASFRDWLARNVADRNVRSMEHDGLYKRLDTIAKAGASVRLEPVVEKWMRWTIVRNAIVHASRTATTELCAKWPDRFNRPGNALTLTDDDVKDVAALSRTLVDAVDERFVATVVGESDARDLVCRMYYDMTVRDVQSAIDLVISFLGHELLPEVVLGLHVECGAGRRRYP